jgi:hypothetical protein
MDRLAQILGNGSIAARQIRIQALRATKLLNQGSVPPLFNVIGKLEGVDLRGAQCDGCGQ